MDNAQPPIARVLQACFDPRVLTFAKVLEVAITGNNRKLDDSVYRPLVMQDASGEVN